MRSQKPPPKPTRKWKVQIVDDASLTVLANTKGEARAAFKKTLANAGLSLVGRKVVEIRS